jgi:ketosteroid isomerase-like protein
MSQENVELVERSFELFLRGDLEAFTDMMATYLSGWIDYSAELKELVDAGDEVIAVLHETAGMGATGVALDRDLVPLWAVRNGRVVFLRVFQTKAEALEAAGPSE